jgi:mRNA interferase MazF
MRKKEIWLTDQNPVKGSEQSGLRPVVIISGYMLNSLLPIIITCPLTTKLKNMKGNVVLQPNHNNHLKSVSEILTHIAGSASKIP